MSECKTCVVCGERTGDTFAADVGGGIESTVPACDICWHDETIFLWAKSYAGILTAGELPVGAVYTHLNGHWTFRRIPTHRGCPDAAISCTGVEPSGGIMHASNETQVILISLPAPEKPGSVTPPPDSALLSYDEIIGVLGSGWEVCHDDWKTLSHFRGLEENKPISQYPWFRGVWWGTYGVTLPCLYLRRKSDGQRVRFEVPGDWCGYDVKIKLGKVAAGDRAIRKGSPYDRHVTWLDSTGSDLVPLSEIAVGEKVELVEYKGDRHNYCGLAGVVTKSCFENDTVFNLCDGNRPWRLETSAWLVRRVKPSTGSGDTAANWKTMKLPNDPEPIANPNYKPLSCSGCKQPFNEYRVARMAYGERRCGDCIREFVSGQSSAPIDTRIAEAQPDQPERGHVWDSETATPGWEGR